MYKYKIQWLFNQKENAFKLIKLIGVKSLDCIIIRDYNLKIIDSYNGFIKYHYGAGERETIKYLKKYFKNNANAAYVEVLRKWFAKNAKKKWLKS